MVLLQVFSQVKVFGKADIVDRCLDIASKTQFVLIKTSADFTKQTLPDLLGLSGEAGPWPAHVLTAPVEGEEFEAKLLSFLRNEGKTPTDVKDLLNPSPQDMNTALINSISSLVDKCNTAPADTQLQKALYVLWCETHPQRGRRLWRLGRADNASVGGMAMQ